MTPERQQEIAAHLERAEQSIQAAKDLVISGYHDFAASRATRIAAAGRAGHQGCRQFSEGDQAVT